VQTAIGRAVEYLWSVRRPDGTWPPAELLVVASKDPQPGTRQSRGPHGKPFATMSYPVGTTALACFALLESGVGTQNQRMAQSLRWLARQHTTKTYSLGLRANVWLAPARHRTTAPRARSPRPPGPDSPKPPRTSPRATSPE